MCIRDRNREACSADLRSGWHRSDGYRQKAPGDLDTDPWYGSDITFCQDVYKRQVMQFPFCIFTLQGFMSAVPRDYEESARIDGATNIQLLLRVMVPLAKPGIATITMLSAMGFWNEYPLALVLLTEDAKKTLPIGMANLFEVQKYATDWGALFAGLVIVMIPTIIIYLIRCV